MIFPAGKGLASICCGFALAALPFNCAQAPPTAAEEEHSVAPVKVAKIETMPVADWTPLLGMTQPLPNRVARISAPVEGRVVSLLQDANGQSLAEGQEIKAGTVVAQLDTRIIREQLKQAEFAVRQAEIEVKRLETLVAGAATSGATPLVSRIELQRARLSLEDTQSKQKVLEEQIKLFTLTSPIDGRLGLMQAVPGQTLASGALVVEVMNLDEIDVLCFVPPHDAARLALKQSARITAGAETSEELPVGKVAFLAVQAQPDTGNYAVKVRFPNPKLRLRANAVLSIQVQTQPEKPRDMIPEAALMEDQDPPAVVIVEDVKTEKKEGKEEKLGKARKLQAIIGVRDREKHLVQIVRLQDPEKKKEVALKDVLIVTEGGYGLHDDDVVKIEEEETK
jgi:membrane fusion protein (multidrug efflux system)